MNRNRVLLCISLPSVAPVGCQLDRSIIVAGIVRYTTNRGDKQILSSVGVHDVKQLVHLHTRTLHDTSILSPLLPFFTAPRSDETTLGNDRCSSSITIFATSSGGSCDKNSLLASLTSSWRSRLHQPTKRQTRNERSHLDIIHPGKNRQWIFFACPRVK